MPLKVDNIGGRGRLPDEKEFLKADGSVPLSGTLDANHYPITKLSTPGLSDDYNAVNLRFLQHYLSYKAVISTGSQNLVFPTTTSNGMTYINFDEIFSSFDVTKLHAFQDGIVIANFDFWRYDGTHPMSILLFGSHYNSRYDEVYATGNGIIHMSSDENVAPEIVPCVCLMKKGIIRLGVSNTSYNKTTISYTKGTPISFNIGVLSFYTTYDT